MPPNTTTRPAGVNARRAMSLVELLAVMAIIVILIGLLAPAINTMTSTAGRKGALNILMNTLEQARAAALESGSNVYVILWKREFPEQDSVIVMREANDWDKERKALAPDDDSIILIPMTKYIQMPKGVLLYDGKGANVFKGDDLDEDLRKQLPVVGKVQPKASELGYFKFSPSGVIQHPGKDDCRLIVSEGVRGAGGTEAVIATQKEKHGGFEIITFRRFTGRASVDVSTMD